MFTFKLFLIKGEGRIQIYSKATKNVPPIPFHRMGKQNYLSPPPPLGKILDQHMCWWNSQDFSNILGD